MKKTALRLLFPFLELATLSQYLLTCFENILLTDGYRSLFKIMASVVVFWHIYTPIHELLHVAGCVLGGGTVESLALQPQYGAHLLQKIFPFIVPDSDYAGQLTGFTTPNAWVYAMVDYMPYLLSLPGLWLIQLSQTKKSAVLFGIAILLVLIPIPGFIGDYYEACSLLMSWFGEIWLGWPSNFLLTDDLPRYIMDHVEAGTLNLSIVFMATLTLLGAIYTICITLVLEILILERIFGKKLVDIHEFNLTKDDKM